VPGKDSQDDRELMVEKVFWQAFPDASAGEQTLTGLRQGVIAERLGFTERPTERVKQKFFRDIANFGYDKSMLARLSGERTLSEIALFIEHSSHVFRTDIDRAEAVPGNLGQNPALDGTLFSGGFNRASLLLDEDLRAIDRAVSAAIGRQSHSGGKRTI
jgi:hypothetical protein